MSLADPMQRLTDLLGRDKRYHTEAYGFVFEALRYAQDHLHLGKSHPRDIHPVDLDDDEEEEIRHVTGQELCGAIRQYAIEQFGLMAHCVLNAWGVRETGDFGEIVFNLIETGQMRKTDSDRREDFNDVFTFDEAFKQSFSITKSRPPKQRRS